MAFKSRTPPLCHCCGKPIPKQNDWHFVSNTGEISHGYNIAGPLYSKADCQRKTNHRVISLSYRTPFTTKAEQRSVASFTTWDGESYKDEFFCSGPCIERFAYLMALAGRCSNLYNQAIAKRTAA